jgi:hypothetical protein
MRPIPALVLGVLVCGAAASFDHMGQGFGTAECEVSPIYAVYGSRP